MIGKVESLWRYPVKSMRGEEMEEMFAGYAGVYGDRLFAFVSDGSPKGFPYFTGRNQRQMICYRARFRDPVKAAAPSYRREAEENGAWPLPASAMQLAIEVETPGGTFLQIDDPSLIDSLRDGIEHSSSIKLLRSDRAMTDCAPLSMFSLQTVRQLQRESGVPIDKRQFRANIYLDLPEIAAFAEDEFVGRSLRLGSKVVASITKRDGRCMMITLNPDTAEKSPGVLKTVAQKHEGKAGLYAAVLIEGMVRKGDPVELLD
ncbi:MAG: MOSC domain-containing protein [Chthoniobacterales bacterium]